MAHSKPMTVAEAMKVLSVEPGTGRSDVRRAYLKLVKVWHPDLCGVDETHRRAIHEQATKMLNEAFALLEEGVPSERPVSSGPQEAKQDRSKDGRAGVGSAFVRPETLVDRLRDVPEVGAETIFRVLMTVLLDGVVAMAWLFSWLSR